MMNYNRTKFLKYRQINILTAKKYFTLRHVIFERMTFLCHFKIECLELPRRTRASCLETPSFGVLPPFVSNRRNFASIFYVDEMVSTKARSAKLRRWNFSFNNSPPILFIHLFA
ncbi:hypothetical protein L596_000515 [Steinernema carpocapsae]|uniref:Uncharacterized protein n=1 Tax=Steinernema carpocapsae TaxID=34508 RepID=A0A4U8UMK8_STECR|nr:hypothetical protein L596_000515 [Steinernema carpocapsae]